MKACRIDSAIDQLMRPDRNDIAKGLLPDDGPQLTDSKPARKHLCIAEAVFIAEDNDLSVEAFEGSFEGDRIPVPRDLIRAPLQQIDQLGINRAASVVPDIDDDRLFIAIGFKPFLEFLEVILPHGLKMEVADFSVARLLHEFAVFLHPGPVAEGVVTGDRFDPCDDRALPGRLAVGGQLKKFWF